MAEKLPKADDGTEADAAACIAADPSFVRATNIDNSELLVSTVHQSVLGEL